MHDQNRPEIIPEYIVIGDDSFEDLDLSPEEIEVLKRTCDDDVFAEICGLGSDIDDDPSEDSEDGFLDDF